MAALLDRLSASGPPLWLDCAAYAGRLFAGGKPPWLDATALASWQRKAQGLLKSDVISLPLAALIEAWLDAHAELRTAMAEKKRTIYALKTLLANEPLRAHLVSVLDTLRGSIGAAPLALQLPSPRSWIAIAHAQAQGSADGIDIGADEVDSAAVLVADFLRAFGESGVDGLLLEEATGNEPANAEELGWYQPVLNVAAHYRWDVGLHLPAAAGYAGEVAGLGFVIAPHEMGGVLTGLSTAAGFWAGEVAPALAGSRFRYARIPVDAVPEQVLDRIAALRSA